MRIPIALLLIVVSLSWQPVVNGDEATLWKEVLGSSQALIPAAPFESVNWRENLDAAMEEAQATNAPVLVTFRCLPCKQCAAFDKNVLEGSTRLTPLLKQFVTVRITDAADLDERYFPYRTHQDLDLSWWGYFLSPKGELYGVFGGKDHVSDATRISEVAFVNSLQRVLMHHYNPRRESWNIDGPPADPAKGFWGPKESVSFETMAADRPHLKKQDCMHCHQVGDLLHVEAMDAGRFDPRQVNERWPLPENIGVEVDRDHGLQVTQVVPDSPAAKAGIQADDELLMANRQKLFGQADLRGVLHRAGYGEADILLGWKRDGELHFGTVHLSGDWRVTENRWRKTVYDGIFGPRLGFFPIPGPNQGKGSMSFRPFMGRKAEDNVQWATGLRPNMEIVAVNGRRDDWDSRELLGWFRFNHQAGDKVVLTVKQGGREQEITIEAQGKD